MLPFLTPLFFFSLLLPLRWHGELVDSSDRNSHLEEALSFFLLIITDSSYEIDESYMKL